MFICKEVENGGALSHYILEGISVNRLSMRTAAVKEKKEDASGMIYSLEAGIGNAKKSQIGCQRGTHRPTAEKEE